jgi:hypothetical protein
LATVDSPDWAHAEMTPATSRATRAIRAVRSICKSTVSDGGPATRCPQGDGTSRSPRKWPSRGRFLSCRLNPRCLRERRRWPQRARGAVRGRLDPCDAQGDGAPG